MHGDDVRMGSQTAHGPGFAANPLAARLIQALGLDQREGNLAIEQRVMGQVDALLAAFAEQPRDLVAAVGERVAGYCRG